ncbi:S1C family serine protease [Sediminibacillus massiliensis]|uniref:S1C family serine protease n=1 Tax=Sediminibacillus massiliensis TaxID=1926277 RepID=UPI000988786C|nr:trypsin-like peptidase domain-containing protein [Sediminibacillus massiliensis]
MKKLHSLPILISAAVIMIGILGIYLIYDHWDNKQINMKNTLAQKVSEEENAVNLKSIIHESQKNVVQIEALTSTSEKAGSGFLYNKKGDIITNAHVVKDADTIYVKTSNAHTYTAALVGIGDETDIAVIRVPQLANQSPAQLDTNFNAELGDEIIAVGSPLGFQNSVTLGIISGKGRTFSIDGYNYDNVYQISAQITNGNSGGPLIHRSSGKVVAINSAGSKEGGLGFSIPISQVIETAADWSDSAVDKELDYKSPAMKAAHTDLEKLEENGKYIIDYFFESLSIRDYINAYSLLGSDWQNDTNYQKFRENYIHILETTTHEMEIKKNDEKDQLKISLKVDHLEKESNKDTIEKSYLYRFTVGYENDQVRILKSSREIASS